MMKPGGTFSAWGLGGDDTPGWVVENQEWFPAVFSAVIVLMTDCFHCKEL